MTEILAHDCDGRPLRVGDRVVLIDANERWRHQIGMEFTVAGPARHSFLRCEKNTVSLNDGCDCIGTYLRKADRPQTAKWSDIERETGWTPTKELEEA